MAQNTWSLPLAVGTSLAAGKTAFEGALGNVVTNHSGASEPVLMHPRMFWADEANLVLKMRNLANSAWVTLGPLGAMFGYSQQGVEFNGIAASVTVPIWSPNAPATVIELVVLSDTTTAASDGSNRWEFQVRNATTGLNLRAAAFTTQTSELTTKVTEVITLDQNLDVSANDYLELIITKTGTPTSLATARVLAVLRGYMRGAA